MTTPGRGQVWNGAQLTARLAALHGRAPGVTQHVVYRTTTDGLASAREGYLVPGEARRLTPSAFDFWLARRGLAGVERLSVAVLAITERLAPNGDIEACELAYRRGAFDGPYHGSAARITFTGPARLARFYQAAPDGTLTEIAPSPDAAPTNGAGTNGASANGAAPATSIASAAPAPGAPIPGNGAAPSGAESDALADMHHAVRASCGEGARILSTRRPTVLEAMVGIASILHVARADGREVGCGIIWHGPLAVALQADFPRFDLTPALSVAQSTALAALLDAERLIACETREDELGLAVVTSRCGAGDLMLARFDGETPTLVPYRPGYPADVTPDQQQWLHYIETYEALTVLDAYRDGTSTALIVLTGDADGAVFRHHVDSDGIEDWRGPDTGSAVGTLYQARRGGDLAPTDPPRPADAEPAWDHAASADAKPPRTAPVDTMAITATAPFGDAVEAQFPAAAYDIDEASHCVALRRSTASVMHCLRVLEHGLRAHALWRGIVDPSPSAGRRWRSLLTDLRRAEPDPDLLAALDTVRRAWRGATLEVAAKYTEEEAERILHAVESFMRCLAERCDEAGEPADHPDDGTIA